MIRKYLLSLYKNAEKQKEKSIRAALAQIAPAGIFLDLGCADGRKTLWWAKAAKAKKILGIEMIRAAAKRARAKNIDVFVADIDKAKWPVQDSSVNCVFSNLLVEHLTDVDHFISESQRVLKKGDYTIVSTNNLASWHNLISLLFGWAPFDLTNSSPKVWSIGNPLVIHKQEKLFYPETYIHKCVYTTRWLKEWYELYGFKLISVRGSGYYPLPAFLGNIDKTHAAFITLTFKKV